MSELQLICQFKEGYIIIIFKGYLSIFHFYMSPGIVVIKLCSVSEEPLYPKRFFTLWQVQPHHYFILIIFINVGSPIIAKLIFGNLGMTDAIPLSPEDSSSAEANMIKLYFKFFLL